MTRTVAMVVLAVMMAATATAQTQQQTQKKTQTQTRKPQPALKWEPPALIDPVEVKLRNAADAFMKVNADFSDAVAKDCHEIHLDHEGETDRPSHSAAYSCYQSDKPMDDALTALKDAAFEAGRIFPEKLAKLKAMLDDDVAYFAVGLTDYEK